MWSGRKKGEGTRLTMIKGLTVWDIPRKGRGGGAYLGHTKCAPYWMVILYNIYGR